MGPEAMPFDELIKIVKDVLIHAVVVSIRKTILLWGTESCTSVSRAALRELILAIAYRYVVWYTTGRQYSFVR
jgi:hypothetical protein